MTPQQLLSRFRLYLLDSSASGAYTDDEAMSLLNDAQNDIWADVIAIAPEGFMSSATISLVAGTELYETPSWVDQVRTIESSDGFVYDPIFFDDRSQLIGFYKSGTKIGIRPIPGASGTLTLYGFRRPHEMHYGTLTSAVASPATAVLDSDADATCVGNVSAEDDYYNGATIQIVSGTGSGSRYLIADYVGSTRTISVAAWTATPDGTSVYGILPLLSDQDAPLIAAYAAADANVIDGSTRKGAALLARVDRRRARMLSRLAKWQRREGLHVKYPSASSYREMTDAEP